MVICLDVSWTTYRIQNESTQIFSKISKSLQVWRNQKTFILIFLLKVYLHLKTTKTLGTTKGLNKQAEQCSSIWSVPLGDKIRSVLFLYPRSFFVYKRCIGFFSDKSTVWQCLSWRRIVRVLDALIEGGFCAVDGVAQVDVEALNAGVVTTVPVRDPAVV